MSLFDELKRRNVFRVAVFYIVMSWLILQVIDVVGPILVLPDWIARAVLLLLALGVVPTLAFSWIYELTPEGVKKEHEVDRSESITRETARKFDIAVIVLLVLGIGMVVAGQFGMLPSKEPTQPVASDTPGSDPISAGNSALTPTPSEPAKESTVEDQSIAVLPFVNMSSDPEQEYFSDGLAESLLHMLAQIRELRVAARTSSFHFKGHTGDVADIGQQLKVAHVLEGSVRRAGDTVRVTAQLIKVDDGFHLWSGTYDRKMDDIFGIQDEIAEKVVEALKLAILGDEVEQISALDTDSLEAYESYLKGRQQLMLTSHVSLPEAEKHFQSSLEQDPTYILALVSLGQTYLSMSITGVIPFATMYERLESTARRIMELDPDSAAAQAMLGWTIWRLDPANKADASRAFQRAYEQDPDDDFVALQVATFYDWSGDEDRAVAVASRALERDPLSANLHMRAGYAYLRLGEFENALFHASRLKALKPDGPTGWGMEGNILSRSGRFAESIVAYRVSGEKDPDDYELPVEEGLGLITLGNLDAAQERIDAANRIAEGRILPLMAQAVLEYRRGNLASAVGPILEAIDAGIEPRHWTGFAASSLVREYALESGNYEAFLDQVGPWLNVDLRDSQVRNGRDRFLKTMAIPVLKAAGLEELATATIDSIEAYRKQENDQDPDIGLAIAKQDLEATVIALEESLQRGFGRLTYLFSDSSVMDFAADDPRIRQLMDSMHKHVETERVAWNELKKDLKP